MAFSSKQYGDPIDILIAEEKKLCKGCQQRTMVWDIPVCALTQSPASKRCGKYIEIIPEKSNS